MPTAGHHDSCSWHGRYSTSAIVHDRDSLFDGMVFALRIDFYNVICYRKRSVHGVCIFLDCLGCGLYSLWGVVKGVICTISDLNAICWGRYPALHQSFKGRQEQCLTRKFDAASVNEDRRSNNRRSKLTEHRRCRRSM